MLNGRHRLVVISLSSGLAVLGCSSQADLEKLAAADEKLAAADLKLAQVEEKLAQTEAKLTAAEERLAGLAPERGDAPRRPDAHEWPHCRPLSHDSKKPRIPLAKLAQRHPGGLIGIDVSHYDGRPDWSAVAGSEVSFVFVKATQGTTFHDPCFQRNAEGASKNGLLWSAYHVLDPKADAEEQAKVFLEAVGHRQYTLPLVLDIEDHLVEGHPVDDVKDKIAKWLAHVSEKAEHKPMLYVGHNLVRSYFKKKWYFGDHHVWFADYDNKATPDYFKGMPAWTLWQFVDNGEVPSVRSFVDTSVFRGTREKLAALLKKP